LTRSLHFNGKFYAGDLNGVHRVADRLIREIDTLLSEQPIDFGGCPPVLHLPEKRKWEPKLNTIKLVYEKGGHTQFWEQVMLPVRARGGLLVNLCNLAPVFQSRKLLMIHDVQFLFPDNSYPARLRWGYRLLTPLMARTSTQVITVSEYSRQMLDFCGIAGRDRIRVIHNGADHVGETTADDAVIRRLNLAKGAYAIHIASPKRYKNTQVIFDAFERSELSGVPLALVGCSNADLERAGLTAPPGAVFCGRVDDSELRALYESALCLLFPSRTEGFGLPPIEAMACGCPAIVAPAGAIPEVCQDAVGYADIDDPEAWAREILRLRDRSPYRDEKIRAGKARADDFTWSAAGDALLQTIVDAAR
jgi:glycosyltransferase involved in cell wall biosynthesis